MSELAGLPAEVAAAVLLDEQGGSRDEYDFANLSFTSSSGEDRVVNLIPITIVNGELLVAVPLAAWRKTASRRLLPRDGFRNVIKVEVLAASTEKPEECLALSPLKLWVGYLAPQLFGGLELGTNPIADANILIPARNQVPELQPYGPGLLEVADQHFSFLTAQSAAPEEHDGEPLEPEEEAQLALSQRVGQMEQSLQKIQDSLAALTSSPGVVRPRKAVQLPLESGVTCGEREPQVSLPGLDPTVLASAREAGIPEQQLERLSKLVSKTTTMQDVPRARPKVAARRNVLSETEDEEEEPVDVDVAAGDEAGVGPMEKAVLRLTDIVQQMSSQKTNKKSRDVEALLDGVDVESGDPSSTSTSKSKAAVYQKLKLCLAENPKYLYQTVENLMEQDFHQLRLAPGSASQFTSWRAWLEHRSRVGHYPTTIRFCWILAGVLDAMKRGRHSEAQARAALGLLAADQAALDNGNWLMAAEALLEEPPPMASFKGRQSPEAWEQAASKLMDERWLEVLMWRIRSKDSYLESRKRLGPSKKDWNAASSNNEKEKDKDKRKPGGGGGKGGRGKADADKATGAKGSEASQASQA